MTEQNIIDRDLKVKEKFLLWLVPFLIVNLQRLLGLTSRRINLGQEHLDALKAAGKGWIFAIWHTNVLYSPYLNRGRNMAVMISSSRDGELITRVVKRFKNFGIRGSTSRGGLKALKALIKHLKSGGSGAITPDGPRGPAFKLQAGIVTAAANSQAPIVPFHYECTRQWVAEKAWDKHRIPKPFTTFVVSYGEPIPIPRGQEAEEFEKTLLMVEEKLLENMERCRAEVARLRGE